MADVPTFMRSERPPEKCRFGGFFIYARCGSSLYVGEIATALRLDHRGAALHKHATGGLVPGSIAAASRSLAHHKIFPFIGPVTAK